jgi:predicted RNA-binding protein Jag
LLKCSTQSQNHLDEIYESAKACLRYDPEFNYESHDADMNNEEEDGGWDDEEGGWDDDEPEQADDSSAWKVRKGAIKIINAMILSCPAQLKEYWKRYLMLLTERLKERDVHVKEKVMDAMQNLARSSITIDEKNSRLTSTFSVKLVKMRSYVDDVKKDFTKIIDALLKEASNPDQNVRIQVMKTFSIIF